jgi:hypothetical protein
MVNKTFKNLPVNIISLLAIFAGKLYDEIIKFNFKFVIVLLSLQSAPRKVFGHEHYVIGYASVR